MADDDRKKKSAVEEEEEEDGDRTGPESDSRSETGSDDSDSDAEFECSACDKRFSGYLPYKQHLRGKKHARTAARRKEEARLRGLEEAEGDNFELRLPEPFAACRVCRKEFSGPEPYHSHLRSKTHKQKVVQASVLQQVREGGEIDADKLRDQLHKSDPQRPLRSATPVDHPSSATEFECEACEKVFSGLTPYAQHLVSKVHARRVEGRRKAAEMAGGGTIRLAEDDVLVCEVCTVSFSGPQSAALHLKSKNHSKQLDRYVRKLERKREKAEEKASKEPDGDETASAVKDAQLPNPSSVVKTMPSADEEAGNIPKEPGDERDKDAPEMSDDPSALKRLDAVPSSSADDEASGESSKARMSSDPSSDAAAPGKSHQDASDEVDRESFHRYRKYKEYKEIMNSLREDDAGV